MIVGITAEEKSGSGCRRRWRDFLLIGAFCAVCGCASVLNPYKDNFTCPDFDRGRCVHVEEAHRQSLQASRSRESAETCDKCRREAKKKGISGKAYCTECSRRDGSGVPRCSAPDEAGSAETMYQAEVHRKLAALLRTPNAPILAMPKVMRVLVLPYRGDGNELYMMRYVYVMADEPKWVLGENLIDRE